MNGYGVADIFTIHFSGGLWSLLYPEFSDAVEFHVITALLPSWLGLEGACGGKASKMQGQGGCKDAREPLGVTSPSVASGGKSQVQLRLEMLRLRESVV